jgi:hypothetical protein
MSYINGVINKMVEDRINLVKKDYPELSDVVLIDENKKKEFKKEIKKGMMDNLMENMFKRPWNKLPYFHREMKVIEYCRNKKLDEQAYKKMLYEKKFTTKNVEYDIKLGMISSITLSK